jgi:hypothetical protein
MEIISVVEDYGGELGTNPSGSKMELLAAGINVDNASKDSKRDALAKAKDKDKDKYLAMKMLTAADMTRDSHFIEDLDNEFTKGNDN